MIDNINIPDTLPNMGYYHDKFLDLMIAMPLTMWSNSEIDKLSRILGKYCGSKAVREEYSNITARQIDEVPPVCIIQNDVYKGVPKWASLFKWTSIEGLAKDAPSLISEIAKAFKPK